MAVISRGTIINFKAAEPSRIVMMRELALLVLLLALSFMPAAFGLPDEAVGRVVSVVSGDSLGIEMLIADARTNDIDSIKLADIQAPSTVTAEGKASQKYALSLLKNKMVYLDINDNNNTTRNEWSQLICVIYLMDSEYRPVWPPVNRILVEEGYARQNDDPNNEFDPSAWWKPPPVFPPGEKRAQLMAMLEKAQQAEEMALAEPSPIQFPIISNSNSSLMIGSSKKGGILEKDTSSGRVSIGYRK
jgi:endonuclease YncB( thermonuclease family)